MKKVLTPLLISMMLLCNVKSVQASDVTTIKAYQSLLEARETSLDWCSHFLSAYKELSSKIRPESVVDVLSKKDFKLLTQVVSAEIGGDKYTFQQKVNVASVIIYRWRDAGCPSMSKICTEDQFGSVATGAAWKESVTEDIVLACYYAYWFGGEFGDAYFFNSYRTWDGVKEYLGCDGAHYYYKKD
jgi:hypothetical protein